MDLPQNGNILVCMNLCRGHEPPVSYERLSLVRSPVAALNAATQHRFDLIAVFFPPLAREQQALIDLCHTLGKNRHTRETPLLGVVPDKHRLLLERLQETGTVYAVVQGHRLPEAILRDIQALTRTSPGVRIDSLLQDLCPYINYISLDSRHEMRVCGAYRNRLVLGRKHLQTGCETLSHRHCPYFCNPKL